MRWLLALLLLLSTFPLANDASAQAADVPLPDGHFFTQAAGGDGTVGFAVVDDDQARFWTEFQRLGGVQGVGYPISQRFEWDGFIMQVMQKGVLQWRPELGVAYFVNVFDQLSLAGKDDWLETVRSTPRPIVRPEEDGKAWGEIVRERQALLDANPAIKAVYYSVPDPLNLFGLPTSPVVDNGNHYVVRLQRAVIQQWKVDVPWAAAGQVTVANGGDVGREAGLFPESALQPTPIDSIALEERAQPTSRGGTRPPAPEAVPAPAPTDSAQETALGLINYHRALAGAAPVTTDPRILLMAQSHADYYVANYGDSSLAGMGLHRETPGNPGFLGASIGDRADAVGYDGWAVDENMGLVGNVQRMIDWCMGTVNHRWNMIHPSAVHVGYGISTGKPAVDVINIGFSGSTPSVDLPTVYPGDGQTGVPVASDVRETPDPAPGVPRPLGYPITISFHIRDKVQFAGYSLTDQAGNQVELYTMEKSWLRSLALIPARPLRAGETYTATVTGTRNDQPFVKVWSFTTR